MQALAVSFLREGSKPDGRDAMAARFTRARPAIAGRAQLGIGKQYRLVLILPWHCVSFPAPSDALPAKWQPNYQRRISVQDLVPWPGFARWSQRLQDWIEHLLERHFGTEKQLEQPIPSEQRSSAPVVPKSELAQFPGLVFHGNGADLDNRAEVNDDAIRAGLVWFKHRWPGQLAVIDGSEEFRRRAWEIADEVGVTPQGDDGRARGASCVSLSALNAAGRVRQAALNDRT
jgi:hypothetical protein